MWMPIGFRVHAGDIIHFLDEVKNRTLHNLNQQSHFRKKKEKEKGNSFICCLVLATMEVEIKDTTFRVKMIRY